MQLPTLPISTGDGKLNEEAAALTMAFMLFPRDASARDQFLALNTFEKILKLKARKATVPISFLRHLADAPSRNDYDELVGQRAVAGLIAGRLLIHVASMADHHPQHASVLKAVELSSHFLAQDKELPSSPASIKKYWSHYRDISPFWAAHWIYTEQAPGRELADEPEETLLGFLGIAEWFRKRGESIIARGQAEKHGPVLDPKKTWKLPQDLEADDIEVLIGQPTELTMEILRRYRAPKRI